MELREKFKHLSSEQAEPKTLKQILEAMQIKGILHSYPVPNVDDHIHEYGSGSNRVMSLKAEKQKPATREDSCTGAAAATGPVRFDA